MVQKIIDDWKKATGIEQKGYGSFKMSPDGQFGNVWIDPNNLKKMVLTVYDNKGKQLSNMPIPYDLYHLITKRFDSRRAYSSDALDIFDKLLKHAGIPYGDSASQKICKVVGDVKNKVKIGWDTEGQKPEEQKGGCGGCQNKCGMGIKEDAQMVKVYGSVEEVCDWLNVLLGEVSAKNDNPAITNEISQLAEFLHKHGEIDQEQYKTLLKAFHII